MKFSLRLLVGLDLIYTTIHGRLLGSVYGGEDSEASWDSQFKAWSLQYYDNVLHFYDIVKGLMELMMSLGEQWKSERCLY